MNTLKEYIFEKLRINKDTNISTGVFYSGAEFYDEIKIKKGSNVIDKWMKEQNIEKFKVFYYIGNKIKDKVPYTCSNFEEAKDKILEFEAHYNKISGFKKLFSSKDGDYYIFTINSRKAIIVTDYRYRESEWSVNDPEIVASFLLESI